METQDYYELDLKQLVCQRLDRHKDFTQCRYASKLLTQAVIVVFNNRNFISESTFFVFAQYQWEALYLY